MRQKIVAETTLVQFATTAAEPLNIRTWIATGSGRRLTHVKWNLDSLLLLSDRATRSLSLLGSDVEWKLKSLFWLTQLHQHLPR